MKKIIIALCAISVMSFYSYKKDETTPIPIIDKSFPEPFKNGASGELDYTRIDSCHVDGDTIYLGKKFFSAHFNFHSTGPKVHISVLSRDGGTPPDFFTVWYRRDTIDGTIRNGWVWQK